MDMLNPNKSWYFVPYYQITQENLKELIQFTGARFDPETRGIYVESPSPAMTYCHLKEIGLAPVWSDHESHRLYYRETR